MAPRSPSRPPPHRREESEPAGGGTGATGGTRENDETAEPEGPTTETHAEKDKPEETIDGTSAPMSSGANPTIPSMMEMISNLVPGSPEAQTAMTMFMRFLEACSNSTPAGGHVKYDKQSQPFLKVILRFNFAKCKLRYSS